MASLQCNRGGGHLHLIAGLVFRPVIALQNPAQPRRPVDAQRAFLSLTEQSNRMQPFAAGQSTIKNERRTDGDH